MEHKAEGAGQHHIEAPRNGAPVKQGIDAGPVLDRSHFCHVGIVGIENPLAQRIEKDVGRQTGGEHHSAPGKGRILRLFSRRPQPDGSEGGEGQIERQQENAQAYGQIVDAEFLPDKEADRVQNVFRLLRSQEKGQAQGQNQGQGNGHRHNIQPCGQLFVI